MNELHLFAGAGGGILAGQLLGHRTVCAVEWEPYAQAVLVARQNDGTFPPFPIWDDVQTFDGRGWRGAVDVVCGGFPCQDISVAGKGAGISGARSGMWQHMARIIGEVRPRYAFIENSPALVTRGLDRVLCDLAALGFDARWTVLGAADVGAPHQRDRIWILANARGGRLCKPCSRQDQQPGRAKVECAGDAMDNTERLGYHTRRHDHRGDDRQQPCAAGEYTNRMANTAGAGLPQRRCTRQPESDTQAGGGLESESQRCSDVANSNSNSIQRLEPKSHPGGHERQAGLHRGARVVCAWPADPADAPESRVGRVVDGVAHRSHRIKALGNGQVPRVAAAAWHALSQT